MFKLFDILDDLIRDVYEDYAPKGDFKIALNNALSHNAKRSRLTRTYLVKRVIENLRKEGVNANFIIRFEEELHCLKGA
jgi:hypothetical protein